MVASPVQAVKNSPVTTLTTAESIVAFVLTLLVAHHVIGNIDIGTTTQTIAPFVALVIPAIFGAAKWHLVSPVAKVAEQLAVRDGALSDADYARIEALLDQRLADGADTALGDDDAADETAVAVAAPHPPGMAAGAVAGRHQVLTA
jgi:hypothetical protein